MDKQKLKVFFSGTFGLNGTFSINWDNETEVKSALQKDYRMAILGSADVLFHHRDEIVNDRLNIIYTGPFWAETDSEGKHTTTDCMTIMENETIEIDDADLVVCVLSSIPSTGSCGEFMYALMSEKPCVLFYQNMPELRDLTVKARHWWIVSFAQKRIEEGYPVKLVSYDRIEQVRDIISNPKFYETMAISKKYYCPEVPDEGYVVADTIDNAKNYLGCYQRDKEGKLEKCEFMDTCSGPVEVKNNGKKK
jgi:hypothetical protein